ncbi:PXMP2 4 family 4 [Micractinium conductrix]|uniref:PXMP2 4 family 4 n=1 Tax=Micractinium conductrix TaxID=554055 RepID=A0A2P6V9Y7_9CHLO|nr:PXMP2 4 family 4 [Micractinium conductrix]|eukprot:PSC70900.1 PXMP2 4 family 4 [Micractinium conductrix]
MSGAFAGRVFRAYSTQLQQRPWRTQILTTGALWALGDCVAQRVEGNKFDARRCVMTTAYGALCVGPFGHAWYLGLDRAARAVFTPGSAAFVAGKVIADTAVFGPLHVGGYFTYMTLLEGGSWGDAMTKLRRDFWPTFSAELTVWPPLQAVNFKFVPVEYQLLVVNLFTIADAAFMSWARANDGWFPRVFPQLAAQLGVQQAAAEAGGGSCGDGGKGGGGGRKH